MKLSILAIFIITTINTQVFTQQPSKHVAGFMVNLYKHNIIINNQLTPLENQFELGIDYNYRINEKHSVAIGFLSNKRTFEVATSTIEYRFESTDFTVLTHYLYHHRNWFGRIGLNQHIAAAIYKSYQNNEQQEYSILSRDFSFYALEYHLGIGRDFILGNFLGRLSAFGSGSIIGGSYFQYGLSFCIYYTF